jgi:C4-type Zn-finger protein
MNKESDMNTNNKDNEKGKCPKCGTEFHFQMHRGWIFKNFLSFLPIKKFFCARCLKGHYVWDKN